MEFFPDATTVRLKGPHGKYLWAQDDHYRTSQHRESRNAKASWRVERNAEGSKKTVRLKSCYDAYLTADEHHHHDLSILGFSGKKVVQMHPENVHSSTQFDWEPVVEGSVLKLRSCHGTFLRGNSSLPPWCNSVSHDIPRHEKHQSWLHWEVEIVRVPKTVPLEVLHQGVRM
ncbi:unnamed protein product [Calypogeia fissa]